MSEWKKYGGAWKLFENETPYNGELHINEDMRIIRLEILIPANGTNPLPCIAYKGYLPYICGTLFSGAKVLLYNCYTGNESNYVCQYTQQIIHAQYAFWGLHVDNEEDLRFNKALFCLNAPLRWFDLCHYEYQYHDDDHGADLIWRKDESVSIDYKDDLKMTFIPQQEVKGINYYENNIEMAQNVWIKLEYANETTWEMMISDIASVQQLIELGCSKKIQILKTKFYHKSVYIDASGQEFPCVGSVAIGDAKRVEKNSGRDYFDYAFSFKEFATNEAILTNWKNNFQKLRPILDLYETMYTDVGTATTLFLNLTQALETFHARFISDDYSTYKEKVDKLLKDSASEAMWRECLLNENGNRKKIYLLNRISFLVLAEWELPVGFLESNPVIFCQKIVDSRNYYTHYNLKKKESAYRVEELPLVNAYLGFLLQYHVLTLLGFDIGKIKSTIEKKLNLVETNHSLQTKTQPISRKN